MWALKFVQDQPQVLIMEYITCKYCGINILRGSVQAIKNMGVVARSKCHGLNILQAKY